MENIFFSASKNLWVYLFPQNDSNLNYYPALKIIKKPLSTFRKAKPELYTGQIGFITQTRSY